LNHQNNFVGTLKTMSNAAKNFDVLTTRLSVLYNYLDSKFFFYLYPKKFQIFQQNCSFRSTLLLFYQKILEEKKNRDAAIIAILQNLC